MANTNPKVHVKIAPQCRIPAETRQMLSELIGKGIVWSDVAREAIERKYSEVFGFATPTKPNTDGSSIDKLTTLVDALGFQASVKIRRVDGFRFDVELPDFLEKIIGTQSGSTSEEAARATIDALFTYSKREYAKRTHSSYVMERIYGNKLTE